MSHQVFPHGRLAMHYDRRFWHRYDTVIWIDGSIQIKSPVFVRELSSYVGSSGWALLPHPDRDCVYDELGASMPMQKYDGQSLREQVAHYRVTGYPAQAGLWACGVIARTGRVSPQLRQLNEAWWAEIQHWSYQDQLSLPYLLRKLGVSVDRVPLNLWHNDQFEYVPHNRDD
jgi:hypothetical protein